MSYDVSFRVKIEGLNKYIKVESVANITYNVRELIKQSSGWDIKNEDENGFVKDWIPMIEKGIEELTNNPDKYKQYEAETGWGTVEGTLKFYKKCLEEYTRYKNDIFTDKDIFNVTYVYVN